MTTGGPAPRRPLARLGEGIARRPWWSIGVWATALAAVVGVALAGVAGESLFDRLTTDVFSVESESADGALVLEGDTESETVTLLVHGIDLADPGLRDAFAAATAAVAALDLDGQPVSVADPLSVVWDAVDATNARVRAAGLPQSSEVGFSDVLAEVDDPALDRLLADDGRGALLVATVVGDDPDVQPVIETLEARAAELREELPTATVEVGSATQLVDSIFELSERDLARGEAVALPIALVIMLVVFGGFLAAGLPLVGATAAIVGGFGLLYAMTYVMDVNSTVLNVVTAVGLGLSIDYGLLMVSRFREEMRAAGAGEDATGPRSDRIAAAVGRTVDSAGRTSMFSGTVFAIASGGLLVFEPSTVRVIGVGALLVAAVGVLAAATLLPALLAIAGSRLVRPGVLTRVPGVGPLLLRFGDVAPDEGVFSRLARLVQRAPATVTILCTAGLVALGSPIASLTIQNTAVDVVPRSSDQYGFVQTLRDEFPDAVEPRIALVTRSEGQLEDWIDAVARLALVDSIGEPVADGVAWTATVTADAKDAVDLVPQLRAQRPESVTGWVVGQDASTYDLTQSLARDAPLAMLLVALVTFVFLFLATGSFVVPLKALAMSSLSLSAAIGVLVWGFEFGALAPIVGFDASQIHGVDVFVLLLALVFGFGLAMDYEMFILSRIMDQLDAGVDAREAIARGLQRSGRIITSAALIIIVVFGGFASGDLPLIQGLGVALAAAVLLDATIVRMLLVPAIMTWGAPFMFWAPRWAKRLHARIGLSER